MAGSLLVGGAAGAALFGPVLAGAQTTTTTPDSPGASTVRSNEDPAHEANETPEQEAAEDAGTFRHGGGHGPNEDPAHEANETPEQEAAEHAGGGAGRRAPSGSAPSTAPSSGAASATRSVFRS
jgi:hypothetical protein